MENIDDTYDHAATLNAALMALGAGNRDEAAALANHATETQPDDAEGWSVLGLATINLSNDNGHTALVKATEMEPGEPRWYLHLGKGLMDIGDAEAAQPALAKASELSRGHPEAMKAWALSLMALNRYGDAAQIYGRILQTLQTPDLWIKAGDALMGAMDTVSAAEAYERAYPQGQRPPEMLAKLANVNITLNQYDKAEVFNDAFLEQKPDDPDAGLIAANLKRWRGEHAAALDVEKQFWTKTPDHAGLIAALLDDKDEAPFHAALKLAEDETVGLRDRRRVSFALARYYDRQGDTDNAWHYAERANSLYTDPYVDLSREEVLLEKALSLYESLPENAPNAAKMIYVMGPPRCGGSLLQTILSRVEGVKSVGERGALMAWMIPGVDDPEGFLNSLTKLAGSDLAGMARAAGTATYFVDKASPHIIFAGLLSKIHAQAKFVLPTRNSKDMAVSMMFHDFPPEFKYTRSVKGISEYLKFQAKAAQAWRDAGLEIIDHDHDAFVADTVSKGQALFEALELPWSDEVLDTGSSEAVVHTFSARQVREGVSKKFQGRGERYTKYLSNSGF